MAGPEPDSWIASAFASRSSIPQPPRPCAPRCARRPRPRSLRPRCARASSAASIGVRPRSSAQAGGLEAPRHCDTRVPTGSPAAGRRPDRLHREAAAGDQPRDDRVRVPHLPGAELVPAPHGRGDSRHEIEEQPRPLRIVAQAARALDRLRDVGDDAVLPAANLVAEETEATCPAAADRPFGNDAPLLPGDGRSQASARRRTSPRAPSPSARSGRGRTRVDARAARRGPRTRARSAAPSDRPPRAAASTGRWSSRTTSRSASPTNDTAPPDGRPVTDPE